MWFQDIFSFEDDQELMDLWQKLPTEEKQNYIRIFAELLFSYVTADKKSGENDDK